MASTELTGTCNVVTAAVVTSISTFLVTSVFIFIIGFVCGHCFSQRYIVKRSAKEKTVQGEQSHPNPTYDTILLNVVKQEEQDLELKENIAYLTLPSTVIA